MIKYTLQQQIENCRRLDKILERGLPNVVYDHSTFGREIPHCGTAACALGHAFASQQFEGLVIDGYRCDFYQSALALGFETSVCRVTAVADAVFGENSYHRVFAEVTVGQPVRHHWTVDDARRALAEHIQILEDTLLLQEVQS